MNIKRYLILGLIFSNLFSQNINQNIITIIGTTNIHGEIDPCG